MTTATQAHLNGIHSVHAVKGAYLSAKKRGFAFCEAEKKYDDATAAKEEAAQGLDEKPSAFKTILSFVCIGIAIILGYVEGTNVQTSIVGSTGFDSTTGLIIGWCFACIGLVTGELLSSGLPKDPFTGRRKPTGKWYLGLLLTLIYLSGQYYLASRAGVGASDDMLETVHTMTVFILGIAVIEVLFGALFLRSALQVFGLMITAIKIKMLLFKMKRTSRACEVFWQRYTYDVALHNHTHGTSISMEEETEAIARARAFYNSGGM